MSNSLPLIRLASFGFVIVCSLIVLGLTANFVSLSKGSATSSSGLGLATSVITLVTIGPAIVLGLIRQGAFNTMVAVELGEVGLLWVLWLATAANVSNNVSSVDCNLLSLFGSELVSLCRQGQAFQAFSWLAWITLTIYLGILLTFSIIANSRGNTNVWSSSVVDTDFLAPGINKPVMNNVQQGQHSVAPMMHQQQYPPQQATPQLYTQPAAMSPQLGAGQPNYQSPQVTGGSTFQQPTPGAIHV
jgi:hypothetical protein